MSSSCGAHNNKWSTQIPLHKYAWKIQQTLELLTIQSSNSDNAQRICAIFGFVTKNPKNFLITWKSVQENLVDYFTKHHYEKHHKRVRPIYIYTDKTPRSVPLVLLKPLLQGCVDALTAPIMVVVAWGGMSGRSSNSGRRYNIHSRASWSLIKPLIIE